MKKTGTQFGIRLLILMAIAASAAMLPGRRAQGQETAPAAAATEAKNESESKASSEQPAAKNGEAAPPAQAESASPAPASAESEKATTNGTVPAAPPAEAPEKAAEAQPGANDAVPANESSLPTDATQPKGAGKEAKAGDETTGGSGWLSLGLAAIIVALFAGSIFIGSSLSRMWKMPDHGWKISLVLFTLAASILICVFGKFKFGPDLAGGITLVYELAQTPAGAVDQPADQAPENGESKGAAQDFKLNELVGALKKRLDPDGTKELTIREYGPRAVEIIIPEVGQDEMDSVKRKITKLGQLEFRITADPNSPKDRQLIELAKQAPPSQKEIMQGGEKVAEWVAYNEEEFGSVDQESGLVKRLAGDTPEALLLMDPMNVTGEYVTRATKGIDDHGGPAVHFAFNSQGAERFRKLTSENKPNPATPDVYRHLGIILDKSLFSSPRIQSTISDRGMISGGTMTDDEVEDLVQILDAGRLPAALNKTPISEDTVSPTLGAVTIQKGKFAIGMSMLAVVLFMLIYYRFAGLIACIALTFNLILVLALMVMLQAAFTLPGLAGLVLTIGIAVDANVLIYERMREELKNGAALRMAIRNGFSRAMSAIIDSNVTTIITGIVLFYLGTDQVKGFAVTLVLGLLTSLFTAIFVTRLIFDVAERRGWIKDLPMMKLITTPNIDFLGARWPAIGASLVLIGIGMVAVYSRGSSLLDIDFTGGSSVTFTLRESAKMPINGVRNILMDSDLADKNLLIVERGTTNTRFTVDTSEQSVDAVKEVLRQKFGDKLMTYSFAFSDLTSFTEGTLTGTQAKVAVNSGDDYAEDEGVSHDALRDWLRTSLAAAGHAGVQPNISNPNYHAGSNARFKEWTVRFIGLDEAATKEVLGRVQGELQNTLLFPLANTIGGRVSRDMQTSALLAIVVSLVSVVIYLWLRFQKVSYGLAAAIAVAHDVLVTIGMLALSYYVVNAVPGLAQFLKIDSFQINLTIVAALLTIIGYSLNDTIVTFDRLREIKGKSPRLTPEMVNASVNQCLSRTILTALTVFMVVVILFFFGGEGIHSFAFAFLVGVIAGTYSTVFIAAPVLLWLSGTSAAPAAGYQGTTRMEPAR